MITLAQLSPMLLDERKIVPKDQSGYIAEIKFDGYRVMSEFGLGRCKLQSKNGADYTHRFAEVASALAQIPRHCITDGEMCILDELGRTDFDALHARASRRRRTPGEIAVTYCMFDLLVDGGVDIRHLPLELRKKRLASLLTPAPEHVLYVQHVDAGDAPEPISWLYSRALELQLEGVVAKLANSPYQAGERSADWFKLKRPGAIAPGRFRRKG